MTRARVTDHELDAAAIDGGLLRDSYRQCRRLAARHGRTYFLATRLLPARKRPHVHALYALARAADDIVDRPVGHVAQRLEDLEHDFMAGSQTHGILPAVQHTVARYRIDPALFSAFFDSMRADLVVSSYQSFDALCGYMYGSAEVIGLQLLPILGPAPGVEAVAATYARDLGRAFQLTNFIRDIGEDLARGRVYLPREDLTAFGIRVEDLRLGVVDGRIRQLLAFEIARTREIFRTATHGVRLLDETSRDCVATALSLYAGILDAVERSGYRVFDQRVSVGLPRRLTVFAPALVRAAASRRPHQTHQQTVWTTREKPNSKSSTGA
jgi:phytoene synthase